MIHNSWNVLCEKEIRYFQKVIMISSEENDICKHGVK